MCLPCRASKTATCPVCSAEFRGSGKTCSKSCGGKLMARRRGLIVDDRASRRAADRLRCARRRAATAAQLLEVVDPDVVLERDGWRCHLCGGKIRRRLSGLHRLGPTIDHLVPLSQGGEHSYANVAAAHRACNSARGTGGSVQLALVG